MSKFSWLDQRPWTLSVNNQQILKSRIKKLSKDITEIKKNYPDQIYPEQIEELESSYNTLDELSQQRKLTARHIIDIDSLQEKIEKMFQTLQENELESPLQKKW